MYFRQVLNDQSACASYLLGCKTHRRFAVVDPHVDLVEDYLALAEGQGVPIVAVLETHVQADHVSGLPELVARTGARAYLPDGAGVEFEHQALADGEVVELGNTELQAIATPGHAPAHHAYLVTDRTRAAEPWLVGSRRNHRERPSEMPAQAESPEQRQRAIVAEIATLGFSLPGSVSARLLRCGNPRCRCRENAPTSASSDC